MKLTGLRGLMGQEIDFYNGFSHYVALGLAEEYGLPVALCIGTDAASGKQVLIHSFVVIGDCLYYDAKGFFMRLESRQDILGDKDIYVQYYTAKEAKDRLKQLKVCCTDSAIKKFIREQVRAYWIAMDVKIETITHKYVYFSEGKMMGRNWVYFLNRDENGVVGQYICKLSFQEFLSSPKVNIRFEPRVNYKGLRFNEIYKRI